MIIFALILFSSPAGLSRRAVERAVLARASDSLALDEEARLGDEEGPVKDEESSPYRTSL